MAPTMNETIKLIIKNKNQKDLQNLAGWRHVGNDTHTHIWDEEV